MDSVVLIEDSTLTPVISGYNLIIFGGPRLRIYVTEANSYVRKLTAKRGGDL